jgi:predicted ATPase
VSGPLRVAFTGASGTGKTTLAKLVSTTYGLPINPIGSREIAAKMGFASPYDVDLVGRRAEFQRLLLAEKIAWENEHEAFVTDRTVVDNLTYTALHDVASIDEATIHAVRTHFPRYTHRILCPMASFFDAAGDPARVKGRAYHEIFEGCLRGMFEMIGASYTTLPGPRLSLQQRFSCVQQMLNGATL